MNNEIIIAVCSAVVGVATTISGLVSSIYTKNKIKKLKDNASMHDRMLIDIMEAEATFSSFKSKGIDAGGLKKNYVMNDLQSFAISKGLTFDSAVWGAEVERMIEFSNSVNCNVEGVAKCVRADIR